MRSLLVVLHAMAASASASCSSSAVQPTEQASAHAAASMAASSSAASPSSALQPTEHVIASTASSSVARHFAEVDVTDMWTRIQKLGRFPNRFRAPDSEAEREENALLDFLEKEEQKGLPHTVWEDMQKYGASQPVDAAQMLLDEVAEFLKQLPDTSKNRCPRERSTNPAEKKLARKIREAIKKNVVQNFFELARLWCS